MKIALTGFGPFGEHKSNPTEALVNAISAPEGIDLCRRSFSVRFSKFETTYARWLEKEKPDAILNLGLSAGTGVVRVEQLAHRFGTEGSRQAPAYRLDGPSAFESEVDTHRFCQRLRKQGVPASPSFHAGDYLCNFVYYQSLRWLASSRKRAKKANALFLHLPYPTETVVKMSKRPDGCHPSLPTRLLETAILEGLKSLHQDDKE